MNNREEAESSCETRDCFSDSFSEENESVSEKLLTRDRCSSEEVVLKQDNFWHPNYRLGYRNFEYIEKSSPCGRVPLMAKVILFLVHVPVHGSNACSFRFSIFTFGGLLTTMIVDNEDNR